MKALLAAVAVTLPALALPSLAQAHPDHSNEPVTLWHALTEPDHAAMIALGVGRCRGGGDQITALAARCGE